MHLMVYGVSPCFLNLTGAVKITKTNTFQFLCITQVTMRYNTDTAAGQDIYTAHNWNRNTDQTFIVSG